MTEEENRLWNNYLAVNRAPNSKEEDEIFRYYYKKYKPYCLNQANRHLYGRESTLVDAALVNCQLYILDILRKHDLNWHSEFTISFKYLKCKIYDFINSEILSYNNKHLKRGITLVSIDAIEEEYDGLCIASEEDKKYDYHETRDLYDTIVNSVKNILTNKEMEIFERHFINDERVNEISSEINKTPQAICQMKKRMIRKMKKHLLTLPGIDRYIKDQIDTVVQTE